MEIVTPQELSAQAHSLAKTAGLNTPAQVGVVVIFWNRLTGDISMRAAKTDKGQMREILRKLEQGAGSQVVTEGVDLPK